MCVYINIYTHKSSPLQLCSYAQSSHASYSLLCKTYRHSPNINFSFRLSSNAGAFIFFFLPKQQPDVTPNESQPEQAASNNGLP